MSPKLRASSQHVVLLLGAGTAVSLLGDSTLYTVLPRAQIAAQVGISLATVGVLLGVNRAVRLLTNGGAGVLYDRLPRRPLLVGSLFLGAVSTLIFAVGYGAPMLMLSRLLWGVAWSGIWVGGNAVVLDAASEHNRGRLSGQYQMWFFLGSGATALFGGILTDALGFRQTLLIGGCLTLLAALAWLVVLPDMQPRARVSERRGESLGRSGEAGPKFPWRMAVSVAIPMFVTRTVYAGVLSSTTILWLTDLLGDRLSIAAIVLPIATITGAFSALRALVSLLGAGGAGYVSDLLRQRWLAVGGVMLVGAGGMWLAGSHATAVALGGALLAAVTAGGVQALVPAIAGDRSDAAQHGRVLGVAYTLGDLGSALGPPLALGLVGWLAIGSIYRLCAGMMVACVIFAFWQAASERALQAARESDGSLSL